MKRSSTMRYVYGLGLIVAAIGFILPIIDAGIFGTMNGFDLANSLKVLPQICLYVLFGLFCVGGIIAFIPKFKKYDSLAFLLIIIDIVAIVLYFIIGNSGGSSALGDLFGSSIRKLIMDLLGVGAWILLVGFIVAIVGFILKPKR